MLGASGVRLALPARAVSRGTPPERLAQLEPEQARLVLQVACRWALSVLPGQLVIKARPVLKGHRARVELLVRREPPDQQASVRPQRVRQVQLVAPRVHKAQQEILARQV